MLTTVRPPYLIRRFYNRFTWRIPTVKKEIFLTFDDGPLPGPTNFVLDTLSKNNIKATFFCIGENIKRNPEIYKRILTEGHKAGNHTYSHLNGWQNKYDDYIKDVNNAEPLIDTNLFRPPYGRISLMQSETILQKYKIIMWDVLSYDFDNKISPQKCLQNVTANSRPGSVIVFHDSVKAFKNLEYTLPLCIEYFKKQDYIFSTIP